MSGVALSLVLAAALLHAGWNRLLHGAADRLAAASAGAIAGAVALLPATCLFAPVRVWPLVAASGVTEALYLYFLTAAYRRGDLSFTYPVARGIAPFLVTVGGALLLGQPPGAVRVAGALALGAGLVVISHVGLTRGHGAAVAFAALTGLTIATYSVIDAGAVRSASPAGYFGAVTAVEAVVLLAVVRPGLGRLRSAARVGTGIGLGSAAAYLLVLFAFTRAPAGPVATLRELSILFGVLLARDRPGARVWLGAALCTAGAVLALL